MFCPIAKLEHHWSSHEKNYVGRNIVTTLENIQSHRVVIRCLQANGGASIEIHNEIVALMVSLS